MEFIKRSYQANQRMKGKKMETTDGGLGGRQQRWTAAGGWPAVAWPAVVNCRMRERAESEVERDRKCEGEMRG